MIASMTMWTRAHQAALGLSLIMLACLLVGTVVYALFGPPLIEAIYHEQAFPWLNGFITNREAPLEHYLLRGRVFFSRVLFVVLVAYATALAGLFRRRVWQIIREFFSASTEPLNLAVFRIVLFYLLFHEVDLSRLVWFSQMPEELRVTPWGSGWLMQMVPINAAWATMAWAMLRVASFSAMIGIWTRTSALVAVVTGIYVLGIPQFFGKVNHYHHLIWFAGLLAVSRCRDALSFDSLIAAWRRADRGTTEPPGPSRAYALPLRMAWLLMGVLYFFPGFWKWWISGFDWALSENLKFRLYLKWMEFGEWTPFFRIDQYPVLYRSAAVGTLLFELSFLGLMFLPRLRSVVAAGGVAFHTLTGVFMRISFTSLKLCYVAFVNWHWALRWIGRRLYREPMHVLYDGNCRLCRRTIGLVRAFDLLGGVRYVNALDAGALRADGLESLDQQALMVDMHAVTSRARRTGYDAYRALAWRIPFLWPILPLLYLWPVTVMGRRIYRHVADGRRCDIAGSTKPVADVALLDRRTRWRPVAAVGGVLLAANIYCGMRGMTDGWPFACYPTFRTMARPTFQSIDVSFVIASGEVVRLDDSELRRRFSTERYQGLIRHILSTEDPDMRRTLFQEFWKLWVRTGADLKDVRSVQFYRVEWASAPEQRGQPPVSRELLYELVLADSAMSQTRLRGGS